MLTESEIRARIQENGGRGIVLPGIENEIYHKMPGYSSSDAKDVINMSLPKFLNKKKNPSLPTVAKILGTMIHTFILEPEEFWNRYYKEEGAPKAPPRNTTEGKEKFKKWSEANHDILIQKYKGALEPLHWQIEYIKFFHPEYANKSPVTDENLIMLEGIKKNVENHPKLSLLMKKEDCEREIALFWICPDTDLLCKCKPDIINHEWPCVLDVKSCESAEHDDFEGNVTNWDMHVSGAWYLWGTEMVYGKRYDDFILIPCEKPEPFVADWFPIDPGSLDLGDALGFAARLILKRYHDDLKNGTKKSDLRTSKVIKFVGVKPYAMNKLSQVIFKHDLQGHNLEARIFGA